MTDPDADRGADRGADAARGSVTDRGSGAAGGSVADRAEARRPRRHRRVTAPATHAGTDPSDDDVVPTTPDGPTPDHPTPDAPAAGGGRDAWILEQRPPHWD